MKTVLLAIILTFLGIVICFLTKYNNRRDMSRAFDLQFWLKDNWPELTITLLFDAAMMILVMTSDIKFDFTNYLPDWIVGIGSLSLAFGMGLGLAAAIYEIFKAKIK